MGLSGDKNNPKDWKGSVEIPSFTKARELLVNVRDNQDKESFETVLRIYTFAKKPETEEQLLSISIIGEAYRIGSIIFYGK